MNRYNPDHPDNFTSGKECFHPSTPARRRRRKTKVASPRPPTPPANVALVAAAKKAKAKAVSTLTKATPKKRGRKKATEPVKIPNVSLHASQTNPTTAPGDPGPPKPKSPPPEKKYLYGAGGGAEHFYKGDPSKLLKPNIAEANFPHKLVHFGEAGSKGRTAEELLAASKPPSAPPMSPSVLQARKDHYKQTYDILLAERLAIFAQRKILLKHHREKQKQLQLDHSLSFLADNAEIADKISTKLLERAAQENYKIKFNPTLGGKIRYQLQEAEKYKIIDFKQDRFRYSIGSSLTSGEICEFKPPPTPVKVPVNKHGVVLYDPLRWINSDPEPSVPGPSVPGPSVPRLSVPGPSVPGPSVPRLLVPGPSVPGPSVPRLSVPGPSVPGPSVPRLLVPGPSVPGPSVPRSPGHRPTVPRLSVPGSPGLRATVPRLSVPGSPGLRATVPRLSVPGSPGLRATVPRLSVPGSPGLRATVPRLSVPGSPGLRATVPGPPKPQSSVDDNTSKGRRAGSRKRSLDPITASHSSKDNPTAKQSKGKTPCKRSKDPVATNKSSKETPTSIPGKGKGKMVTARRSIEMDEPPTIKSVKRQDKGKRSEPLARPLDGTLSDRELARLRDLIANHPENSSDLFDFVPFNEEQDGESLYALNNMVDHLQLGQADLDEFPISKDDLLAVVRLVERQVERICHITECLRDERKLFSSVRRERDGLSTQLTDQVKNSQSLESEIRSLQDEISEAHMNNWSRNDEVVRLRDEVDHANLSTNAREDELTRLRDELDRVQRSLHVRDEEVGRLRGELDRVQRSIHVRDEEVGRLRDDVDRSQRCNQAREDEVTRLRSELDRTQRNYRAREAEYVRLQEDFNHARRTNQASEHELSRQKELLDGARRSIQTHEEELARQQELLETTKRTALAQEQELTLMRDRFDQQQQTLDRANQALQNSNTNAIDDTTLVYGCTNRDLKTMATDSSSDKNFAKKLLRRVVPLNLRIADCSIEATSSRPSMYPEGENHPIIQWIYNTVIREFPVTPGRLTREERIASLRSAMNQANRHDRSYYTSPTATTPTVHTSTPAPVDILPRFQGSSNTPTPPRQLNHRGQRLVDRLGRRSPYSRPSGDSAARMDHSPLDDLTRPRHNYTTSNYTPPPSYSPPPAYRRTPPAPVPDRSSYSGPSPSSSTADGYQTPDRRSYLSPSLTPTHTPVSERRSYTSPNPTPPCPEMTSYRSTSDGIDTYGRSLSHTPINTPPFGYQTRSSFTTPSPHRAHDRHAPGNYPDSDRRW